MSIGQSFQGGFNSGIAYMRQLDDHAQRVLDEDYRGRTASGVITPQVSQRVAAPTSAGIAVPAGRAPAGGRPSQVDGAAYVDPSELPLGMRMNERNRLAADASASEWVKQRQEDRKIGIMERDQGIRERVQDVNEAESKSKIGINEAAEGRAADVHKLDMDNEKRLLDHQSMMQAFVQKNPQAVTYWFVKNAPKDAEGYQQIPTFDMDEKGNWLVKWPGAKQAVPMTEDQLGEVLQSLSPKYERANSERERAETKLLKEGKLAPKGYGSAGIDVKGMEELRQKQAKYISESSVDDLGVPQITYEQAYEDLGRGGIFSQQPEATPAPGIAMPAPGQAAPGDRQVVRTGKTKNGLKVVQYSDGSIDYIDPATGRKVK